MKNINGWRWLFWASFVYFFISGYSHGLANAATAGALCWGCYQLGRASLLRDIDLGVDLRSREDMIEEQCTRMEEKWAREAAAREQETKKP